MVCFVSSFQNHNSKRSYFYFIFKYYLYTIRFSFHQGFLGGGKKKNLERILGAEDPSGR